MPLFGVLICVKFERIDGDGVDRAGDALLSVLGPPAGCSTATGLVRELAIEVLTATAAAAAAVEVEASYEGGSLLGSAASLLLVESWSKRLVRTNT